jgi:hypothetical protein
MRWLNLPRALALHGANCQVDQPEVPIHLIVSNHRIGIA